MEPTDIRLGSIGCRFDKRDEGNESSLRSESRIATTLHARNRVGYGAGSDPKEGESCSNLLPCCLRSLVSATSNSIARESPGDFSSTPRTSASPQTSSPPSIASAAMRIASSKESAMVIDQISSPISAVSCSGAEISWLPLLTETLDAAAELFNTTAPPLP